MCQQKITYPFDLALHLSGDAQSASYEANGNHLHVVPLEDWLLTGILLTRGPILERAEEEVWCKAYLEQWGIPLESGWLPDIPLSTRHGET